MAAETRSGEMPEPPSRSDEEAKDRWLVVGILVLPLVFVWWLLRPRHDGPLRQLGFAYAAGALLPTLALFIFAFGERPDLSPTVASAVRQAEETHQPAPETVSAAPAAATVPASEPSALPTVAPVEATPAQVDDAFSLTNAAFIREIEGCETFWKAAQRALARQDPYASQERAIATAHRCSAAATEMSRMSFAAPVPEAAATPLQNGLRACAAGYRSRAIAMRMAASAVDSGMRPSDVNAASAAMVDALKATAVCRMVYAAAARELGFDPGKVDPSIR